jgi:hypothetical protein
MVDVQSSATAPSFDAASAEAMAATLRMIIDKHGIGLLANHRKLFGLLRDYAPSEPRAIRVVMSAFDLGIAERLAGPQTLSPDVLESEARSLAADTGLRDDLARWAVDVWAKARASLHGVSGGPAMSPTLPSVPDVEAQPAGGSNMTWGSTQTPPPEAPAAVSAVASTTAPMVPEPPPVSPVPKSAPEPASMTWGSEQPAMAPPPPVPTAQPAVVEPVRDVATLPQPVASPPPSAPLAAASLTWGSEPHPASAPLQPAPPAAIELAPVVAAASPVVPASPPAMPPAAGSLMWGSEPQAAPAAPPPAPSVPPQPPLAVASSVPPIAPNAPSVPPAPASLTWGNDPQAPPGPPPTAPSVAPAPPTTAANVAWYLNPKVGAMFAVVCSIIYFGANYIGKHPFDAPAPTTPARPAADPVAPVAPVKPAPVVPVTPADPGPAVVGSTSANPNDWPDISGSRIDGDKSTWKYEMNIKMPDGHFYIYEVSVKMTGIDVGIGVVRAVEWTKRAADVSFISVATRPIITRFFSDSSKSFHTSVSTPTWDKDPTSAPRLCFAFNSGTTKQRFQPDGGYVCASPMNGADCVDIPIGCGHFK